MQPRTKKGPTWANEAQSWPEPSPVQPQKAQEGLVGDGDAVVTKEEGISDLEWMKRRVKDNVDAAFEQSDDEEDAEKTSPPSVRVPHS